MKTAREPRYSCLTCRDTGWAVCWSRESMHAAMEGNLGDPFTLARTSVCCDCGLGRHKSEKSAKREGDRPWVIYDARVWLLLDRQEDGKQVIGKITDPAEQERLVEFMGNFHENSLDSKQWNPD